MSRRVPDARRSESSRAKRTAGFRQLPSIVVTGVIRNPRSTASSSNSALVWLRVKVRTISLTRSNSESGSAPLNSCSPYAIQSLSRVASSQKPCSQMIVHQLGGEDAERRAEQKSHRDVAVAGGPDQRDFERAHFHSARHPSRVRRNRAAPQECTIASPSQPIAARRRRRAGRGRSARARDEPRARPLPRRRMRAGRPAERSGARAGDPRRRRGSAVRPRP